MTTGSTTAAATVQDVTMRFREHTALDLRGLGTRTLATPCDSSVASSGGSPLHGHPHCLYGSLHE